MRNLRRIPQKNLKVEKITKEKIYETLIKLHSYTPEEISLMTPYQQLVAMRAHSDEKYSNEIVFNSYAEYIAWKQSGNK